jgi:hypothetical protein
MKRRPVATRTAASVFVVAVAAGLWAHAAEQPRPNFSGVWSRIRDTAPQRPAAQPVRQFWAAGQPVTFTQDEGTLTIAYKDNGRNHSPVRLAYDLHGAKAENMHPSGPWP